MDVLQGEDRTSAKFNAAGRHETPFMLDLPPWFGHDAAEVMVARFSKILLGEIVEMVEDSNARRRRFPSLQSNAGVSIVDDESPTEERDDSQDFLDDPFVQPLPVAN